ncbi:MAG: DUF4363 family protein [Bacillota bacterium]
MRRILAYLFPVVLIAMFSAVFLSGSYLKRPFGAADDFAGHLDAVEMAIMADDWSRAGHELEQAKQAWQVVTGRIQFSVEREEIRGVNHSLARLGGRIQAADSGGALAELAEAREHWERIAQ